MSAEAAATITPEPNARACDEDGCDAAELLARVDRVFGYADEDRESRRDVGADRKRGQIECEGGTRRLRMILDTDYLIRLFGGGEAAREKSRELYDHHEIQRVPAPVLSDLEYGAE